MGKYLKDPSNFLLDSGVLFEINRMLLHPLGLALTIELPAEDEAPLDPTSEVAKVRIVDASEDPEGLYFDNETFLEGRNKSEEFWRRQTARINERSKRLNFVLQFSTVDDPPSKLDGDHTKKEEPK